MVASVEDQLKEVRRSLLSMGEMLGIALAHDEQVDQHALVMELHRLYQLTGGMISDEKSENA